MQWAANIGLHWWLSLYLKGECRFVLLLLGRGADINEVGGEYGPTLAVAAFMEEVRIVSLLLD